MCLVEVSAFTARAIILELSGSVLVRDVQGNLPRLPFLMHRRPQVPSLFSLLLAERGHRRMTHLNSAQCLELPDQYSIACTSDAPRRGAPWPPHAPLAASVASVLLLAHALL